MRVTSADFAAFIRHHQPDGVTVSVGGEIGEVGGKNSDVHELHAYMEGFNGQLNGPGHQMVGLSKISVQTGTAHGGFVNRDGTVRADVKIDLQTLDELSRVSRTEYGLGGTVQHGASTLASEASVKKLAVAGSVEFDGMPKPVFDQVLPPSIVYPPRMMEFGPPRRPGP